NIDIKEIETNKGPKKKSALAITASSSDGYPLAGNFSVSVTDAGKVPVNEDDETTILSNLLLTSDLRGYIEQPNYYFNDTNQDKARQLDNLLLTQGWRRFKWEDIAAGKEPDITFRPEQSLAISGKITTWGNKPIPNAKVMLVSTTRGFQLMLDTVSDAKGGFVFDMLDIPDSASFMVQAKGKKDDKSINITIDKRPRVTSKKEIAGKSIDLTPFLEAVKEQYKDLEKFHLLPEGIAIKEVKIVAEKPFTRESELKVKNSVNALGTADHVITRKQMESEWTIASALNKVLGVTIRGNLPYSTRGQISLTRKTPPMLVILDGISIPEDMTADVIKDTNPKDIEGIEVLTSFYNRTAYGPDGVGGVIHITTKRGGSEKAISATNVAKTKNRGFSAVKEFYTPD
ncbi:MAG: TonB-dependent receptor, partial [Sphingobacteriales bacterium]